MAVMQMQRVSICALKKDRKAILEELQRMGIMEISQLIEEDESFRKMDTVNARQSFEKSARLADQALAVLDQHVPEKRSLLSGLEGKKPVDQEQFRKVVADKETIMSEAKDLVELNREIAESKAHILKLENQIESLKPWMALDVPMNCEGTAQVTMLLGTMAPGTTLEAVYTLIAEHAPEVEAVDVRMLADDKDAVYLVIFCFRREEGNIQDALRAGGFAKPSQVVNKIPGIARADFEAEKGQLNHRIAEIRTKIEGKASLREGLEMVSDYFRVRADKYGILGTLPQSQRTFIISGYAAKAFVPEIEKAVGDRFDCIIDIEELKEDEEPPVILRNNHFSSSVEGVLESYALPHKGEFDPTTWMSFFYVFFFGMMLSDAAYGAILAAACFVILKKFPHMSEGMRGSVRMFMYCGISTLIWGILFGGYFGNVVEVVSQTFFGKQVAIPPLWFAPLDNPMKLLVYSLAFGLVHLFVGLGIKGYMLIRDGKVLDFFCDVILWYALLIGLILLLMPTDIFASIAQTEIVFPPAVNLLAKALAMIGAVGLVLMSGRDNKNLLLRLAFGAYDLYNVTGWLSDVLSYSRLLALGLATGVIASVINQMAGMAGKSVMGAIMFVVIFVVGHTLNLAINLLGAYVHTNRLQFVEFFGKFYEGGGRAFEPFRSDTKYVTIQESEEGK
ncbi:MAG: V-type ATP synthase subunit I [Eubacteriales bacterium]|nr:V-type ATP synthase subunit I [Eubacteriales bacterium]